MDYTIQSNQTEPHENLSKVVARHINAPFQHPISTKQKAIFERIITRLDHKPIILDCGCGQAMSTQLLAARHPDHWVIGIDKSGHRLGNAAILEDDLYQQDNILIVRAELVDFILLAHQAQLPITKQYHLYPNPWPKSTHLKRRWHGHPIFPTLMALSTEVEIRSNWRLYLEEWQLTASQLGYIGQIKAYRGNAPITHFERKYWQANEPTYSLLFGTGS